ncbi:MAG TPA: plasmid recombination protein [Alphaproteobacteria bacterium]|nr:plasmid recombination protein [Alphaproteobacteria bacterium]
MTPRMAHDRKGPDIVMQARYVSASEVRAVSLHSTERTADGWSAIDTSRSAQNRVLHGPATQQEALEEMWAKGVKRPAKQSETPFVQMVLSASPGYFRAPGQGPGEWDADKLAAWEAATLKWLRDEYGDDLAHVDLHLDEETPHMHVLIVPTYGKTARKPGRQKRGETPEAFAARVAAAAERPAERTAGRSSSPYWSQPFARRDARRSYHARLEAAELGIGYGRDFIEEGEPSPQSKTTGAWVRERAALLAEQAAQIEDDRAALEHDKAKHRATVAAFSSMCDEIEAGTLKTDAAGKIVAADPATLRSGGPDVVRVIKAVLPVIESAKADRAAAAVELAAARKDREWIAAARDRIKGLLRSVLEFGPRVRSVLNSAESSAMEREAARSARAEIVSAVPSMRREIATRDILEMSWKADEKPSSPAEQPIPEADGGPGFGEP